MENTKLGEVLRAKVVHEDTWIQQRVNWLLASNASLFAALAALTRSQAEPGFHKSTVAILLPILIPLVGLILGILVLRGLRGADLAIRRTEWQSLSTAERPATDYPSLTSRETAVRLGRAASQGVATTICVVWAVLLIAQLSSLVTFILHWRPF